MSIYTRYTNFGDFCEAYYNSGWIIVSGDDLKTPSQTLDDAWEWLSSRYKKDDGGECLDFIIDEILEDNSNKYAAKLLISMLHETDPVTLKETARLIRHDYAQRKIEHFKARLVNLDRSDEPTIHDELNKDLDMDKAKAAQRNAA